MLSTRFVRLARLSSLRPDETVSHRALALAFCARFVDEVTSEAAIVLTPVFRRVFGLSLVQVGLLTQVLTWIALVVEPYTASLIDVASRRRLMTFGAAAIAISMIVMGLAPSYVVLLVAFGLFAFGSGPLAHTADVVVVESFPDAPERAYTRATFIDTVGATLGPLAVAVIMGSGLSWRVVLVALGLSSAAYALAISRTPFPLRRGGGAAERGRLGAARHALHIPEVRRALVVLLCVDLFEGAFVLKFVWLHESVGLSESAVAVWGAAEQVVALVALALLDRWLDTRSSDVVLGTAAAALVVLPGLWVAAPGVGGRIAVGVALVGVRALVWPLAKSRSLIAAPEFAGAVQAITTLFGVLPFPLVLAALAGMVGIGPAMAGIAAVGAFGMVAALSGGRDR